MKNVVGLWIDHRQAVIVSLAGGAESIQRVSSGVERQHRQAGESSPADDARQREMTEELRGYYQEVVSRVRDAESILIFGPGEAKGELRAQLEKERLGARVVGVEACDRLTDPQIVAKVRGHYLGPNPAAGSR